jgi:hypothetical protein
MHISTTVKCGNYKLQGHPHAYRQQTHQLTCVLSSEVERRETVDPVSDGLRGTTRVDGRRPLPVTDVQLFGILMTQRLWKLRLQPTMINKASR